VDQQQQQQEEETIRLRLLAIIIKSSVRPVCDLSVVVPLNITTIIIIITIRVLTNRNISGQIPNHQRDVAVVKRPTQCPALGRLVLAIPIIKIEVTPPRKTLHLIVYCAEFIRYPRSKM
jgi:hypothetical protein